MTRFVEEPAPSRAPSIVGPPSLVEMAATTLRRMIVSGQLPSGQRIVENRLTQELGISRPPLREALRVLEREGLVRQEPRKGVRVTEVTLHDIHEIVTLRREFEKMAVRWGVPVRERSRLRRCRAALGAMTTAVDADDELSFTDASFDFHVSIVGLSGNQRLEEAYRSLQLQLMLSMALTRSPRTREDLVADLHRHDKLLEVIEDGEVDTVLDELSRHDERAFLAGIESKVDGHTEVALQWLRRERASMEET